MTRLLLDTHALYWWQENDPQLVLPVRDAIGDMGNEVFFSPVSAYEIAYKHVLGKLAVDERLLTAFAAEMTAQGFIELPVSAQHALTAGRMRVDHRDPFDRLLAGQALWENLVIASSDRAFDGFGVPRLWD